MENAQQTKDRIKQLKFEIDQAERRKRDCGTDAVYRDKNATIISEKTLELRHLEASLPENIEADKIIDSDNNEYRDRHNRFTYDKDCVE